MTRDMELRALIILTETLCANTAIACHIAEIGRSKGIPVFSVDGVVEGCYNLKMEYHDGFERVKRDMDTEAMLLAADRQMYADKLARGKERR